MDTRTCAICHEAKTVDRFYRLYKDDNKYRRKSCKDCDNNTRKLNIRLKNKDKPKRSSGFDALPEETHQNILADLNNAVTIKKISEKYDIKVQTLYYWSMKGHIPKKTPKATYNKQKERDKLKELKDKLRAEIKEELKEEMKNLNN